MKQKFNFSFLNLGCTKNLVDTQYLMGNIFSLGANNPNYHVQYVADPYDKEAEFVFLNTCGFIKTGRDEMMATIEKLAGMHLGASNKKIYLLGCGLQYFKSGTTSHTEGFDQILKHTNIHCISRNDFENITLTNLIKGYNSSNFEILTSPIFGNNQTSPNLLQISQSPSNLPISSKSPNLLRAYTNAAYGFEYLKIAEGCDNNCTFCIIPKLRGKQKSIPIENILIEIKNMLSAGIQEIILIAQDTGRYGTDLYGEPTLMKLLSEIDKIPGKFRYKLLYLYPDTINKDVIRHFSHLKKFIPYFDIPFQHISKNVLKKMGRFVGEDNIFPNYPAMISEIRKTFPRSFIRTNIIIGFPGETEKDFQELKKFIQEADFDNIALFEYHDEPLAASSKLPHKVPENIIRKRFLQLDTIVDQQITTKEHARKGQTETGFVMNIKSATRDPHSAILLVVRPALHAPEMDPYDTITLEQITKVFNDTGTVSIGDKITYKV